MEAFWLAVVLDGAAVLVLTAIVVLGRLLLVQDSSKIDWPLDVYVKERLR
jgi:hypothetical protein